MRNQALLLPIAILGLAIAALYPLGIVFFLFWKLWWYDVLLHFLGGVFVVCVARWGLFALPRWCARFSELHPFLFCLIIALAVGILWEVFEFTSGLTFLASGYWFDTMKDLCMDTFGGIFAYALFYRNAVRVASASLPV